MSPTNTLLYQNKVKDIVASKGGKLADNWVYAGCNDKFEVDCGKGHNWNTCWSYLNSGCWCPECDGQVVYEEDIRKFIEAKGGSVEENWHYVNSSTPIPLICHFGHHWTAPWGNIQQTHWCPECVNHVVHEENVRKFIENKGWKLDDNWVYINSSTPIPLTCKLDGYKWAARWHDLNENSSCPDCIGYVVHEEDVRKLIKDKGGRLEDNWKYVDRQTMFPVICEFGHRWFTTWRGLQKNHWCHFCHGQEVDPNAVRELIQTKGGKLDNDWKYVSSTTRFFVTCSEGHRWETLWNRLHNGNWCPICHKTIKEQSFRLVLENLYHVEFPRKRPSWMKSPLTGAPLELDGYNEKLKIAFEYQGKQHYELCYINRFSSENLQSIQQRDAFKKQLCAQNGVRLIVMPYWVPKEDWENEIQDQILIQKKREGVLKLYAY
jgi:hypothetical protein